MIAYLAVFIIGLVLGHFGGDWVVEKVRGWYQELGGTK